MTAQGIKDQIIINLNVLHLWFKENKAFLGNELNIKNEKLDYTTSFFSKLLVFKGLPSTGARTLNNLFKKRGALTVNVNNYLKQLISVLEIDIKMYSNQFEFQNYADIDVNGLFLNHLQTTSKAINSNRNHSSITLNYFKDYFEIYKQSMKLILEECNDSIQGVMNGGISGKSPEYWFKSILEFLKSKDESPSPVNFDLIIICTEDDFQNHDELKLLKQRILLLRSIGLTRRFKIYVCIQNHLWLGPDFLIIDRNHLFINWPTTLEKLKGPHRTQRAIQISESFELIQDYKEFFERIIKCNGKCILLSDYLNELENNRKL